jgi:hypothetical protein
LSVWSRKAAENGWMNLPSPCSVLPSISCVLKSYSKKITCVFNSQEFADWDKAFLAYRSAVDSLELFEALRFSNQFDQVCEFVLCILSSLNLHFRLTKSSAFSH